MLYSTKEHIILHIAKRAKRYDLELHVNPTGESKETGFLLFVHDFNVLATMSYNAPVGAESISFTMFDQAKEKTKAYTLRVCTESFRKEDIVEMLDSIEAQLKACQPKPQAPMGFLHG